MGSGRPQGPCAVAEPTNDEVARLNGHRPDPKDLELQRQLVILALMDHVSLLQGTLYHGYQQIIDNGVVGVEAVKIYQRQRNPPPALTDGSPIGPPVMVLAPQAASMPEKNGMPNTGMIPYGHHSRFEEDFERVELLGRGGFGEVWRCRHRVDKHEYAVKAVHYSTNWRDAARVKERVEREAVTWASISHPNIVRYHNTWSEQRLESFQAPARHGRHMPALPAPEESEAGLQIEEIFSLDDSTDGGVIFQELSSSAEGPGSDEAEAAKPKTPEAVEARDLVPLHRRPNRGPGQVVPVASTALVSPSVRASQGCNEDQDLRFQWFSYPPRTRIRLCAHGLQVV